MKNLVIVESPAKAKTIEKFLGPDFKVMSSFGHIRDLRKKGVSIDMENNFEPQYEVMEDKTDLVKKLKSAAKSADMVWLASDEDREGEAIAWHLYEVLGLKPETTRRIVFHEITKPAILHAIENPRDIDINKVNAQQARRVLDRIVGFELSPVLWKKIKPALSAGRVQSVAVRLICEREKEIKSFVTEPFFRINALFEAAGGELKSELNKRMDTEEEARDFLESCSAAEFTVADVKVKPIKRSPLPPFTTSTLQQEANRRLGFSVNTTMHVAQKLYEAGHITYMRTDSLNLSSLAVRDIAENIKSAFGDKYLHSRNYHTNSKGAQEAHEAIRPTYINSATIDGTEQEKKLYGLIRSRTLASQMSDAILEKTNVDIRISTHREEYFEASGEVVKFDGFMKVYAPDAKENEVLPAVAEGDRLQASEITATERFTQAPPRYTEASLVKKMEELGIGRPSTYAPTISTIQNREYVAKGEADGKKREYVQLKVQKGKLARKKLSENFGSDKGRLVPTDIGMVVNDFLTQYFPDILDYNFTAKIEEKFDDISEGKLLWNDEIREFYDGFHPEIKNVDSMRMQHKVGERRIGSDPATGKPVYVKIGRYGPVVQMGDTDSDEKPQFASLRKGQSMEALTLEEALKLFELPRQLGEFEGKTVTAAVGRFGPYVRHDGKFVSIPKTMSPLEITLDEAIELINGKRSAEASKTMKEYAEMPGLKIINGRFGPYIAYKPEGAKKAENYRLPKGTDAAAMTFEEVKKIMESQSAASKKKK